MTIKGSPQKERLPENLADQHISSSVEMAIGRVRRERVTTAIMVKYVRRRATEGAVARKDAKDFQGHFVLRTVSPQHFKISFESLKCI